jgi:hypothetical protein
MFRAYGLCRIDPDDQLETTWAFPQEGPLEMPQREAADLGSVPGLAGHLSRSRNILSAAGYQDVLGAICLFSCIAANRNQDSPFQHLSFILFGFVLRNPQTHQRTGEPT